MGAGTSPPGATSCDLGGIARGVADGLGGGALDGGREGMMQDLEPVRKPLLVSGVEMCESSLKLDLALMLLLYCCCCIKKVLQFLLRAWVWEEVNNVFCFFWFRNGFCGWFLSFSTFFPSFLFPELLVK